MQTDIATFEVIRHKLWAINDEAGATIKRISGSPIATEALDFNTGILTAEGDLCLVGVFITSHASVQDTVVKHILQEYIVNPGINEGDMFVTNDPYAGALHQPDVTCVAPIHWEGKLIAWCGCTVHQIDMGGPIPGSFSVGVKSIYEEATPIPPIKIVEGGTLRKDLEREYLRRSRTPHLVALDLRAKIAANNVTRTRIHDLIRRYGWDTVQSVLRQLVEYVDHKFRNRLRELPDGQWRHVTFIEHDGVEDRIYPVELVMTKQGERLTFDYSNSAEQGPALINCCRSGLRGAIMGALLPMLCFDMPWTPAGLWPSIAMVSRPGSIVDAQWPAGVSMSTLSACWAARTAANICLGKMLGASAKLRDHAMAAWEGSMPGQTFNGIDQRGEVFGTMFTDTVAGGTGAISCRDGLDNGGIISSMGMTIANVEVNEYFYPLLYLYRRQLIDSAGAGKFRGGVGGEHAITPYGNDRGFNCVLFSHGVEHPASGGIFGGLPGSTIQVEIKRHTNLWEMLKRGTIPDSLVQLSGEVQIPATKAVTALVPGDVMRCGYPGGGGYGDPLDRTLFLVQKDVQEGLVSRASAEEIYGVKFAGLEVDPTGTGYQRQRVRSGRRSANGPSRRLPANLGIPEAGSRLMTEYLEIVTIDGQLYARCTQCQQVVAPLTDSYKDYVLVGIYDLVKAGPQVDPYHLGQRFELKEFYCPGCLTLLEVEVNLKDSTHVWDVQLC